QPRDYLNFSIFVPHMNPATDIDILELEEVLTETVHPYELIVWNDDVNTFEWVIETLVEICGHTYEQAEQCAYIIHFNGKYAVKKGSYEVLRPKCDAILDRGINATIEVIA
ncbi:MAG TPA: ATP-dependent Clp protease adaptor ClpS, partial [Flavisolibacter sp.]|nr:ATP-dependent Clp protease adaptor ClpS [Flavisolibacter sp.]